VSFLHRLQERWKVRSRTQVLIILCVFALTGSTVVYLKRFALPLLGDHWYSDLVYYVAILPVYNLFLLVYGFAFGQGRYFWEFEKRFFSRLVNLFK